MKNRFLFLLFSVALSVTILLKISISYSKPKTKTSNITQTNASSTWNSTSFGKLNSMQYDTNVVSSNSLDLIDQVLLRDIKTTIPENTRVILGEAVNTFVYIENIKNSIPENEENRIKRLNKLQQLLFEDDYNLATLTSQDLPGDYITNAFNNLKDWIARANNANR